MNFIDKDLKGRVIDQTTKSRKSIEIEGDRRFCGHRFVLGGKLYGDKRCLYCGRWFHWKQQNSAEWVKNENIDPHNVDDVLEPLHCGNAACDQGHRRYLVVQAQRIKADLILQNHRMMQSFKMAKAAGLVH